jgi:hypothetical protein
LVAKDRGDCCKKDKKCPFHVLVLLVRQAVVTGESAITFLANFGGTTANHFCVMVFLFFARPVVFGPVAGVCLLASIGLLTFDVLWKGLLTPAWYLLLHLLEANFITPVLLGRRFTLNPVVIFVSLTFWTWLWGVPGVLLSVPILVSIRVVCDRVPAMSHVSELLTS